MQEIEPQRYGTHGGWQLIVKLAGTSAMGGGGASEGQTGNGTAWEKSEGRIGHLFRRSLDSVEAYRRLETPRQIKKIRAGHPRCGMDAIKGGAWRAGSQSTIIDWYYHTLRRARGVREQGAGIARN